MFGQVIIRNMCDISHRVSVNTLSMGKGKEKGEAKVESSKWVNAMAIP